MKRLKLFFILSLISTAALAKTSDTLVLRGYVAPIMKFSLRTEISNISDQPAEELLSFRGDKRNFKVKKIQNKNSVYLEVSFH